MYSIFQFFCKFLKKTANSVKEHPARSTFEIVLGVSTILLTLLSLNLTNSSQKLTEDRAVTELGLQLMNSWNEAFNETNRSRIERFRYELENWKDNDKKSGKSSLEHSLKIMINKEKVNDPKQIRADKNLMKLIASDLDADNADEAKAKPDYELIKAVSAYRTTIINSLNLMETIKIIRDKSESERAKQLLDTQFTGIIKIWTISLIPFIVQVRQSTDYCLPIQEQAWFNLTSNITEPRLSETKQCPLGTPGKNASKF